MSSSSKHAGVASSSKKRGPFSWDGRKAVDPVGFDNLTGNYIWRTPKATPGLIASAAHMGSTANNAAASRHGAISTMSSFGEVLNAVPQGYREILRAPLRAIALLAAKWVSAREHWDSLKVHQAKGTFPPNIKGMHYPQIELCAEYKATVADELRNSRSIFDAFAKAMLDEHTNLAEAQVNFLDEQLSPELCAADAASKLEAQRTELSKFNTEPKSSNVVGENGQQTLSAWVTSSSFTREYSHLKIDLPILIARIISIEKQRYFIDRSKRENKMKLREAADVEMGDDTNSSRAISDIVKKELAASIKKLKLVSDDDLLLISSFSNNVLGKRLRSEEQPEGQQEERRTRRQKEAGSYFCQEAASYWEVQGPTSQTPTRQRQEGQRKAESIIATANLRYDMPGTWPDEVLLIPYPLAIRYLLRSVTPAHLEAVRFRGGVHLGPDVSVPDNICIILSAGLKYMPRVKLETRLVIDAYDDFCDRLRWKITWLKNSARKPNQVLEPEDKISPYDPDYRITKDRVSCDRVEGYIEDGLDAGRKYCQQFIDTFEPGQSSHRSKPELIRAQEVVTFLKERKYLVLPTDKNLGVSVVTRQWFITNTVKLLNDPIAYRKISFEEVTEILEKTIAKVNTMADLAETGLQHVQLAEFLRQYANLDSFTSTNLPTFYGIPKIHKQPVKMRPIVPCHSAAQNPAAKYISKSLKAVLEHCPFVLKGTKDLAIRLHKAKVSTSRKKFLVSFDIVAYYPNLPLTEAIDLVSKRWKDVCKPSLTEQAMFKMGIELACRNLVCQFDGSYFLQLQGIAMGVACSPDISNIYGACYEEVFMNQPDMTERIAFYGRFIDDGFIIIYAETAEEALSFCKERVHIGGLELTWDVSELNTPFLDMMVYIDPLTGKIEHKPYRKARSHTERIPYISHHPQDVKRGTFLGEMSRMAVLSSNPDNYLAALHDLQGIYIARGYPADLVRKWTKDNCAKRWKNRLEESNRNKPVVNRNVALGNDLLVLKTTFNPIWDTFNIHELANVVVDHWLSSLSQWGWYNKQLYAHAREVRPNLTHELSWTEVRNIASHDDFAPTRGDIISTRPNTWSKIHPNPPHSTTTVGISASSPEGSTSVSPPPKTWSDISFETTRRIGYHVESLEVLRLLDVRKVGLTTARWLLSRKKNRNLADKLAKVKREVLESPEQSEPEETLTDILLETDLANIEEDVSMQDAFDIDAAMDIS